MFVDFFILRFFEAFSDQNIISIVSSIFAAKLSEPHSFFIFQNGFEDSRN